MWMACWCQWRAGNNAMGPWAAPFYLALGSGWGILLSQNGARRCGVNGQPLLRQLDVHFCASVMTLLMHEGGAIRLWSSTITTPGGSVFDTSSQVPLCLEVCRQCVQQANCGSLFWGGRGRRGGALPFSLPPLSCMYSMGP